MDQNHLLHALSLAAERRGFCAPNPAVGAVIVKNNQVLSVGSHQQAGAPHAEIEALNRLSESAAGATIYVTLEPCCHWGKTPPCTQAIIEVGIKRVVYGYADPNPVVAGKGAQQLREAGVECQQLSLDEIDTFYRSYNYWQQHKRPWVTAKLAMSLDGKIAAEQGQPVQITGPELQAVTHQLRLHSDAILTSVRTINNDNPQLNVREGEHVIASKPVYILDSQLTIDSHSQIFASAQSVTIIHSTTADNSKIASLEQRGADCVAVEEQDGLLDLSQVLAFIGEQGVQDLWVEAGGRLYESLLQQQLINTAYLYIAPNILGESATPAFSQTHDLFARAQQVQWQIHGSDMLCQLELSTKE